jgi:hypothetical protein
VFTSKMAPASLSCAARQRLDRAHVGRELGDSGGRAAACAVQHDYEFLSWGLTAAWVIMIIYVLMMVGRQKKLKREIANLRAMLEERK